MSDITTWDSWRTSDDSPIKIDFDWNDDHSSWRLEEASELIKESLTILEKAGTPVEMPDHVFGLAEIAKSLRRVHTCDVISDAVVRRSLSLADSLDFGQYCESDDASFNHDCAVDNAAEILEAWDRHQTWTHTDEDWQVSAADLFEKLQKSRNGLGDRWSLTIDEDYVELPDGTVVNGLRPNDVHRKLFDEITVDLAYVDDDKYPSVATAILKVPLELVDRVAQAVCDIAAGREMRLDGDVVEIITAVISRHEIEQFNRIVETAAQLGEEWSGEEQELIIASESLVCG